MTPPSNPLIQTDLVGGVGGGSEVVARLLVGAW